MKAVVFDLDDTLLHSDLTISDFTVRVFRKLHEKGFIIIAASGRAQLSMKPYVDQLSCVSAYISCNGAEIWDGTTHALIRQELFSAETAIDIALFAEKHDCYAQVYEGNRFFFNRHGKYADMYASATRLTGVYVGKLSAFIHEPRNKILLIDHKSRISAMYSDAISLFAGKASVTCSKPCYLEFNPVNATKGLALQSVSALFGFCLEDTIAFGDSLNDLSMLQSCGISVAVSNGWKEIVPCCTSVCGSNDDDGPAHYLNDHYLGEEVGE